MSEPKPQIPSRLLVINVMLSLLVSVSVFVVVAQVYIVPLIAGQQVAIQQLQADVQSLQEQLDEAEADDVPPPPPPGAAAAPGAPAPAAPPAAPPAPAAPAKK
jgi:hypothetical protein